MSRLSTYFLHCEFKGPFVKLTFTLVLYYHSSSTSAESDHESAGALASARGQRRFLFSKKSSQRDFQQHPCKKIFSQMKCWLHDCSFLFQCKKSNTLTAYLTQYLRGSSYFNDTKSLHYYICFLNQKTYLEYFHYKIQLISSMLNCAWLIYQTMCINVKKTLEIHWIWLFFRMKFSIFQ